MSHGRVTPLIPNNITKTEIPSHEHPPNAIKAMRRHLKKILDECQIINRYPDWGSFEANLLKFSAEVLKHQVKWLSLGNIFSEFYRRLFDSYNEIDPENASLSGSAKEILGEGKAEQLETDFIEFVESIPRQYKFSFVIPHTPKLNLEN